MARDSPRPAKSSRPSLTVVPPPPDPLARRPDGLATQSLSYPPGPHRGEWPMAMSAYDHDTQGLSHLASMFPSPVVAPMSPFDDAICPSTSSFASPSLVLSTTGAGANHLRRNQRHLDSCRGSLSSLSPLPGHEGAADAFCSPAVSSDRSGPASVVFPSGEIRAPSLSPEVADHGSRVPTPNLDKTSMSSARETNPQARDMGSVSPRHSPGRHAGTHCGPHRHPTGRAGGRAPKNSEKLERGYSCRVCGRSFDKKYNLRVHERRHDSNRKSQFACPAPNCDQKLGRKTDVSRHVSSVHEKAKKFVCDRCQRRFNRKDTLARHCERAGACPGSSRARFGVSHPSPTGASPASSHSAPSQSTLPPPARSNS